MSAPPATLAEYNRRFAIALEVARSIAAAQGLDEPGGDQIALIKQRVLDELGLDEPPASSCLSATSGAAAEYRRRRESL